MNSITRLAFAAAMLGATTLWMAGRPAVTDQSDPLNPGAAPLRFTLATRAADGPGDSASENAEAIELMSNGLLYSYGNGLDGDAAADTSNFVSGSQSKP